MRKLFVLLVATVVVAGLASCGQPEVQIGKSEDTVNRVGPAFSDITIEKQETPQEQPKEQPKDEPEDKQETRPASELAKTVVFETSKGTFEISLFGDTDVESGNMIDKVTAKAYDGLTFHRIIKNFVIQGGDPLGNGTGGGTIGMSGVRTHKNYRGTIAMASSNAGVTQSGMQFFINLIDNGGLDTQGFIAFGEVTKGMDVVDAIANVPTQTGDRPIQPVIINKAYVK